MTVAEMKMSQKNEIPLQFVPGARVSIVKNSGPSTTAGTVLTVHQGGYTVKLDSGTQALVTDDETHPLKDNEATPEGGWPAYIATQLKDVAEGAAPSLEPWMQHGLFRYTLRMLKERDAWSTEAGERGLKGAYLANMAAREVEGAMQADADLQAELRYRTQLEKRQQDLLYRLERQRAVQLRLTHAKDYLVSPKNGFEQLLAAERRYEAEYDAMQFLIWLGSLQKREGP